MDRLDNIGGVGAVVVGNVLVMSFQGHEESDGRRG